MTADWFDLGQRLRAASTGRAVPRLLHAPITAAPHPVAVRARRTGDQIGVTAATSTQPQATASGLDALDLLGSLGVTLTAPAPATLVTDTPASLGLLHRLARTATPNSSHDPVAAHIAWWRDRADFPGGRAVVDTVAACRTRWVTGTAPAADQQPGTWRTWLTLRDDSTSGLLDLYTLVTTGDPLQWLDTLAEDDEWAYNAAQTRLSDGIDWRRPDSTARAALGLRARCDAADLYAAALLTDPLHRLRAVHTGDVVTGTARVIRHGPRRTEVTCPRLDARLRPGTDLTGWTGTPASVGIRFRASVAAATVRDGQLVITLTAVTGPAPADDDPVTLTPAPPSPARQRAGRKFYRDLYNTRRSWLVTGRTPTTSRRPVPLDVLIAGAE